MSTSFCFSYFFHCCICQYYYIPFVSALFMLVTIDVVYVNTVRFKHIDSSCYFFQLNCRGYNLKLKQLLIDGDIESNPGPTQMIVNLQLGSQRKLKCLKEQQKSVILLKTRLMLLVIQRYRIVF